MKEKIFFAIAVVVFIIGTAYFVNEVENNGGLKAIVERIWYGKP